MSEPFIGEIKMFAGTFAPRSYAFCDGQLLQVSQNDALFSLFGTIYGGDGRTTFALPDLRGRVPIHTGQGAGLTSRQQGSRGGSEKTTVTESQMPPHNHAVFGTGTATLGDSLNHLVGDTGATAIYANQEGNVLDGNAENPVGGNQFHENRMPYLGINFIVALVGIYPSRT